MSVKYGIEYTAASPRIMDHIIAYFHKMHNHQEGKMETSTHSIEIKILLMNA